MITFFACPKSFQGHAGINQRNAFRSWALLSPKPEILVLGTDQGVAEICKEFGLIHVPEIEKNELGTPLISSVFQNGQARASAHLVCYINSDIMLTNDFIPAIESVAAKMPRFLVLGQRTDIDINEAWNFDAADWQTDLKTLLAQKGRLHPPSGVDYFCFPRGMYENVPPLVIGRPGFDNWLVWRARSQGCPIVDITGAVSVAHQNHEDSYAIQKLNAQEFSAMKARKDPRITEAQQNSLLVPEEKNLNIWAATWRLDRKGRLQRRRLTLSPAYLYYQLKYVLPLYWPGFGKVLRRIVSFGKSLLQYGAAKST
jgi:hypothetical protein